MALFLAAPAALGYALLSGPLATAVAFGEMATPEGRELLQVCLLGLSLGVVGQAAVEFTTQAAYARGDARRPLEAVALRAVLAVAGMLIARTLVAGPDLLLAITFSVSISELVAGLVLCWTVRRRIARPARDLFHMLARTLAASLGMVPVAVLVLWLTGSPDSQLGGILVVLGVALPAGATYLAAQWLLRSPELSGVAALARRTGTHSGSRP
jgi:putative peptidoglycan lipid II flippase